MHSQPFPMIPAAITLLLGLALLLLLLAPTFVACSSATSSASASASSVDPFERERYGKLPPTVFAPTGRLHMVDRVGLAASNCEDVTAGLVVALRCGGGRSCQTDDDDDDKQECIVVVGTGPRSPLAIQAGLIGTNKDEEDDADQSEEDEDGDDNDDYHSPLLTTGQERPSIPSCMSILSPGLVVATGGSPADAAVFLDRVRDVASDMHYSNFGGTGFTYQATSGRGHNGMFGVDGANLARSVADMIQIPTQSIGTRVGSMLAASALILDAPQNQAAGDRCRIWRVDPSGQFWSCDAAAVGRGAGVAESFLLKEIASLRSVGEDNDDDNDARLGGDSDIEAAASVSNQNVKRYLGSLSVDDAIEIARESILKVYEKEIKQQKSDGNSGQAADEVIPPTINLGGALLQPGKDTIEIFNVH